MAVYLWLTVKSQKQIMKDYGFYTGAVDSKKDDARAKAIRKVNEKYLPKKALILDIGFGSGRDMIYFKSIGYEVEGIDTSLEFFKNMIIRATD